MNKIKVWKVVKLQYDFSQEKWEEKPEEIKLTTNYTNALISVAILNKVDEKVCKYYLEESYVETDLSEKTELQETEAL